MTEKRRTWSAKTLLRELRKFLETADISDQDTVAALVAAVERTVLEEVLR